MKSNLTGKILTSIVLGAFTTVIYVLFECFSSKLHITSGITLMNKCSPIIVLITALLLILLIIAVVRFDWESLVLILLMMICIPVLLLFQFFNPYLEGAIGLLSFSLCWYNFLYRKGALLSRVISCLPFLAPLFCIFKG